MVLILILAGVVTAGAAAFLMSSRKRDTGDTLSLGPVSPSALGDRPPPRSQPQSPPASEELDPAEELARNAALQDTRGPAVPRVSKPRLTSLHLINNVNHLHFVATLGRRVVFVYHPYTPNQVVGVEQGLDEDGGNTGPLFDHLAERVLAAGLPGLPSPRAQEAFQPATLRTPSVHIRARFEDGRSWAGMYTAEEVEKQGLPAGLLELMLDMRGLGLQMVPEQLKSQGARPPLMHFTLKDNATRPGSEFGMLVDPRQIAMLSLPPEEVGGKGTTYMIAQADTRNLVQSLSGRLDALLDLHRVFALKPFQGERALEEETSKGAAFMARIAIGEGRQFWATVLDPADIGQGLLPPPLSAFARDARILAEATARVSRETQEPAA
jgi:hypothetical protein